jgi:hypothetical protein
VCWASAWCAGVTTSEGVMMTPHEQALQQLQNLNLNQQSYASPNGYANSTNSLAPQPILVRLSDDDVRRIVQGVLDGMQERWGRRDEDG